MRVCTSPSGISSERPFHCQQPRGLGGSLVGVGFGFVVVGVGVGVCVGVAEMVTETVLSLVTVTTDAVELEVGVVWSSVTVRTDVTIVVGGGSTVTVCTDVTIVAGAAAAAQFAWMVATTGGIASGATETGGFAVAKGSRRTRAASIIILAGMLELAMVGRASGGDVDMCWCLTLAELSS